MAKLLAHRYRLKAKLGQGGMGEVWLADDTRLGREVAIKLLHGWISHDLEARARFQREARVLASLTHPHIVRLYDYEEAGEDCFLVMEYIAGSDLDEKHGNALPLSWDRTREYLRPICDALAFAHDKGVVHRDLKPSNILIRNERDPLVSDFGVAQLAQGTTGITSTGVLVGTPEYWAPEQAQGQEITPATDIYALGCVTYLMLTAHLPFEGDDRLAVGFRRVHEEAPDPRRLNAGLSDQAQALVLSMLARHANARPTARDLASLVSEKHEEPSSGANLRTLPPRPDDVPTQKLSSRRRGRTIMLLLGLIAIVVFGAVAAVLVLRNNTGGDASASPPAAGTITVPRLVGMSLKQAQTVVDAASTPQTTIEIEGITRQYSERHKRGIVIQQDPSGGSEVARFIRIEVVVSRGTAYMRVPPIGAGSPVGEARRVLEARGFDTRVVEQPSLDYARGQVISLQPQVGKRIRRPGPIMLTVSSGPPLVDVPQVVGLPANQAKATINDSNLDASVSYQTTSEAEPGTVIKQSPAPGQMVDEGSMVNLTVAESPTWQQIFSFDGSGAARSPRLLLPKEWRIVYSVEGDEFGLGGMIVSWESADTYDSFSVLEPGSETFYPNAGRGRFSIEVQPFGSAPWTIVIEAYQ